MILNSPYISGSLTVTGNIVASGSITLSGSVASASFAANAATASFVTLAQTASFVTTAQTASFVANAQSASNAVTAQTASFANALTVAGTLTAQTLVVQTITSSVDFVTGSTRFGSTGSNTHQFTGSMSITGSLAVVTTGTELQVGATGVNLGNALTDSHVISGSLTVNPNGLFVSGSGLVGIGTTSPSQKLDVSGLIRSRGGYGGVLEFYDTNTSAVVGGIMTDAYWTANNQLNTAIVAGTGNSIKFFTSGSSTVKTIIDTLGNVGISTTSPLGSSAERTLHLSDGGSGYTTLYVTNGANTLRGIFAVSNPFSTISIGTQSNTDLRIVTNDSTKMFISSSGAVGIGVTSITLSDVMLEIYKPAVANNWSPRVVVRDQNSASFLGVYAQKAGVFAHTAALNGWADLYVNTIGDGAGAGNNGAVIFGGVRITSDGKVGIGTTTPAVQLVIEGTGSGSGLQDGQMYIRTTTAANPTAIGFINSGNTASYNDLAWIRAIITGGSAKGALSFVTRNSDATNSDVAERMRISSGGIVTTPYQPAFRAGRSSSYVPGASTPIVFNSTSGFGFNVGGNYSTSTGRFTAPVSGIYNFTTCVIWESVSNGQGMDDAFEIKVNGSTAAYSFRRATYVANTTGIGGYYVDHATALLNLTAGQYVEVVNRFAGLTVHGNQNYCYFQGYLVG